MITKRRNLSFILFFLMVSMSAFIIHAQDNPLGQLNQYISDLQKNPADIALREKIIKHVQTMSPAPAIPLEAERYEGRAEFAIKNAKSEADFLDAAKEYGKALLIAPWAPAYYFNQGIAYEKGGNLKEAKQSFEFYLLAAPNAQDAKEVRKRIAGLEYAMEKAAKESSQAVITEKKQNTFEDLLKKIDGRRYISQGDSGTGIIDVKGRLLVTGNISAHDSRYRQGESYEIRGYETRYSVPYEKMRGIYGSGDKPVEYIYKISEDGNYIILSIRWRDGDLSDTIYRWQR